MGFPHSSVGKESTSNAGDPHLRGLKQILCTPRPRDPSETETECLLWRYGSAVDCHSGRVFGCSRPRYGISPLGEGRY